MIKVIMADDHPLVRAGMKYLLEETDDLVMADEAGNGADLVAKLRQRPFDAALMDLQMPGRSGMDLLKQLKDEFPALPVIVLSTFKEEMFAVRSIRAGAAGYLCKDQAATELVNAIRKVAGGQLYISPEVGALMAESLQGNEPEQRNLSALSDREYQILLLLASDMSVSDVAENLCISGKTVSTYKARIKIKLGLKTNADILRFAQAHNLVEG